jgi:MFS family permease
MLGIGAVNVLFIPFLRHTLGASPEAIGGVQAAQGVGMLLGGFVIGSLGKSISPRSVSVGSMILLGVGVGLVGLSQIYGTVLLIMLLVGFSIPPLNAALDTMLQRGVPREMLGRAGSVNGMATSITNLVSMGAAGWLSTLVGLRETFLLGGAIVLLGGLAMGWMLRGHNIETLMSYRVSAGEGEVITSAMNVE